MNGNVKEIASSFSVDYNFQFNKGQLFNSSLNENSISSFNFLAVYNYLYYIWLLKITKK